MNQSLSNILFVQNRSQYHIDSTISFTGKEQDEETGYSYFGARYYDADLLTSWLSVDPKADKYPSMSPYNYCASNPVKLLDLDGREIDLSELKEQSRVRLVKCLSVLTGLSLSFNKENGLLEYAKDDNGNAIVSNGSESARTDLIEAIEKKNEDKSNYRIEVGDGNKCEGGQNDDQDGGAIRLYCDRMSEENDCNTNGLGMVFLHELRHAVTGESDPQEGLVNYYIGQTVNAQNLVTGSFVDRVNRYRQELGMPIRIQYFARKDGYVPFCPADKLRQGPSAIRKNTVWLKINSNAQ